MRQNKKRNKKTTKNLQKGLALFSILLYMSSITAMAGSWLPDLYGTGTWGYNDTNELKASGWKWLDADKNGTYECYYFDDEGKLALGTEIDSYRVNADGQWTLDGAVQRRTLPDWISSAPVRLSGGSVNLAYPQLNFSDEAVTRQVSQTISNYVNEIQQPEEGDLGWGGGTNTLDYDLVLSASGNYLGLSFQHYVYYEGATHGSTEERYYTLTPDRGILQLSDLGDSALEQEITRQVRESLKARMESGELVLFEAADSIDLKLGEGNWMLADDGLHVVFQQYEIAPYAAGIIDVCVPYAGITGLMNSYGQSLVQ